MNLDYLNSIIKAWEAKKTIQVKEFVYLNKVYAWTDAPNFNPHGYGLGMLNDPTKVRVKPEVEWVPLGAKDLPFPCRVRYKATCADNYLTLAGVHSDGITVHDRDGCHSLLTYAMLYRFNDMEYSGTDGVWKSFRKVKE